MRTLLLPLLLLSLVLSLVACGGGGGGGGGSAPSGLVYGTAAATYSACTPIAANSPTVNGTVSSYSVDPALPPGLALDASTGVITGTPSATAPSAVHTVTATGPKGSTTFDLTLEVVAPTPPSDLTYPLSELVALVDVDVSLAPTLSGGATQWTATPPLPAGIVLDPLTGEIRGAPIGAVSAQAHTIQAENCLGAATTFALTVSAISTDDLVAPRFVHAISADGTVSRFGVLADGQLRANGYDPIGGDPVDLAASWTRRHILVLDAAAPALLAYGVDPSHGLLSAAPVDSAGLPAGSAPRRILVDEVRRVAWVSLDGASSVAAFALGGDGSLTAVAGSPFAAPATGAFGLALSADGSRLLVSNPAGQSVSVFAVGLDGALSAAVANGVGSEPGALSAVAGSSGTLVHVALDGSDSIGAFTLAGSTLVNQGTTALAVGAAPVELLAADFSGSPRVYALANDTNGNLLQFDANPATGTLSAPTPAATTGPEGLPLGAVLAPDKSRLWVLFAQVAEIAGFTVNGAGVLTAVAPANSPTNRMRTRPAPLRLALTRGAVEFSRASDAVYTVNRTAQDINQFLLDPTDPASLTPLTPVSVASPGIPNWIAVHPRLEQAYATLDATGDLHLRRFAILPDRTLSELDTLDLDIPVFGLYAVVVDPSGRFLFATARGDARVHSLAVGPTGEASAADSALVGDLPLGLAVTPNGRFVYVANTLSNSISGFSVNPLTGALSPIPGSPFAAGISPFGATVEGTGRWLYVPNRGDNTVSAYTIHPQTGALQSLSDSPFPVGPEPEHVAIDPAGRFVFVTCANVVAPELTVLRINLITTNVTEDGALVPGTSIGLPGNPVHASFDGSGTRLFVTLANSAQVLTYQMSANGQLSLTDTDAAGALPRVSAARSRPE